MITGPLKVVIIGPPKSGKSELADMVLRAVMARGEVDITIGNRDHIPTIAIYDGENITGPSKADIVIMTVQCSAEQFDDPAELLRGYQARAGKI